MEFSCDNGALKLSISSSVLSDLVRKPSPSPIQPKKLSDQPSWIPKFGKDDISEPSNNTKMQPDIKRLSEREGVKSVLKGFPLPDSVRKPPTSPSAHRSFKNRNDKPWNQFDRNRVKKIVKCRDFYRGHCRRGNHCRFVHATAKEVPRFFEQPALDRRTILRDDEESENETIVEEAVPEAVRRVQKHAPPDDLRSEVDYSD
mmetsp:Transcript_78389/g.123498  ORF Transcript_78389/g.123498 Transcript_78389/m.123498 type:complete len:201 (+) Transcript_78389:39-641(+)